MMKNLLYLLVVLCTAQCKPKQENTVIEFVGKPLVPSSIKETHQFLLEQMHKLTLVKDSSGRVALKLEEMMQHHFKEEEDFILPPLGLLPILATGQMPGESKNVILLSEKLKTQLDHMSAEHQLIKAFITELKAAADAANLPEIIEFEKEVAKHAVSEEEIFFPTAILIGEYLKLKGAGDH